MSMKQKQEIIRTEGQINDMLNRCAADDELHKMHAEAIAANKPIFAKGGVFIPVLGIILDINPLSESAEWDDAMCMAKDAGKRLPTIDELRYIYCYKDAIDAIIKERGGTPLVSTHWSCSEYNYTHAWYVKFSSGITYYGGKCNSLVVLAVSDI